MSNIIQLLERMGQDARLQDKSLKLKTINDTEISSDHKKLLSEGDADGLAEALKINKEIICFLIPAKEDEQESENSEETNNKSAVNQ